MYKIRFRTLGKERKLGEDVVDNGNIEGNSRKGLYCREVVACDHVGINYLVLNGTRNFYLRSSGYVVFEEDLCKIVCPECLMKSRVTSPR
jgi:hypothetical protein